MDGEWRRDRIGGWENSGERLGEIEGRRKDDRFRRV